MAIYRLLLTVAHVSLLRIAFSSQLHDNFTDLSALLAFKAGLSDPDGVLAANWTANTSFCDWTGVSCSRRRQRVVALRLANLPLYGSITPYIANLSFLTELYLPNTSLSGSIPDSISQLPRLANLTLDVNQFSGSLPASIFNMSKLVVLSLEYNNLSGTLPLNQTMLPSVEFLALSKNQFTGNIPASLSYCLRLRQFSLSFNQFTGSIPSELGNLPDLRVLYLSNNELTGTIPSSLGNLTNLLDLEFNFNNIHGVIPEEFGRLSSLQILIASANYGITGPIPASLSNISTLQVLDLTRNQITGPVNVQFGNMPSLVTLYLSENNLTGGLDFLSSLSNCRRLTWLQVGLNELEGVIPKTIGNLSTGLKMFVIPENRILGKIPAEIGNLTSLNEIVMGSNELDGTVPSEIMKLEGLQVLALEYNRLVGSIPSAIGRLGSLSYLFLQGNNLSGRIPDSLGNISGLQHLGLNNNSLSADIPESLWSLTGLIDLYLSQNFFKGLLSLRVGNLKSLDTFDASMNHLSGSIPSALKELQMLKYLDLSSNSLEGQIPEELGQSMINLQVLNLSFNNLSGVIPHSLANLRYITSINLSFNSLEGEIPSTGVFLNPSKVSLEGNAELCGGSKQGYPPCSTSARISKSWTRTRWFKYAVLPIVSLTVLIACCCILLKRLKKTTKITASNTSATSNTSAADHYRLTSYHELVRATKGFSEANLIGKGTFGSVYKGCLDDGQLVAAKVFNLDIYGASRSFDVECRALSMVRHRNLVKIISICSNLDYKVLVLEFFTNGSLERWLHSKNHHLNLLQRISIALDVASALEHLHHYHPQVIVHCDIKPSNVLLDEDMTAHLGDFGIAKLLLGDTWTATSTSALGTFGYMPHEYALTGIVSRKGDVYSFGILLLEMFTGKTPTDTMFGGELSLHRWVAEARSTSLLEIVDYNLLKDETGNSRPREDQVSMQECLSRIIELGILCSKDSTNERPPMTKVVPVLQMIKMDCMSRLNHFATHAQKV